MCLFLFTTDYTSKLYMELEKTLFDDRSSVPKKAGLFLQKFFNI